jgi:hypothetical protein
MCFSISLTIRGTDDDAVGNLADFTHMISR